MGGGEKGAGIKDINGKYQESSRHEASTWTIDMQTVESIRVSIYLRRPTDKLPSFSQHISRLAITREGIVKAKGGKMERGNAESSFRTSIFKITCTVLLKCLPPVPRCI